MVGKLNLFEYFGIIIAKFLIELFIVGKTLGNCLRKIFGTKSN